MNDLIGTPLILEDPQRRNIFSTTSNKSHGENENRLFARISPVQIVLNSPGLQFTGASLLSVFHPGAELASRCVHSLSIAVSKEE